MVSSLIFFFSSRRRHTRLQGDWSSDVCSSDLVAASSGEVATAMVGIASGAESQSQGLQATKEALEEMGRRSGEIVNASQMRSEERRVGKEWRWRGSREQERGKVGRTDKYGDDR